MTDTDIGAELPARSSGGLGRLVVTTVMMIQIAWIVALAYGAYVLVS